MCQKSKGDCLPPKGETTWVHLPSQVKASPREGQRPSTLEAKEPGRKSRLLAKARMAAAEGKADHREAQAWVAEERRTGEADAALWRARSRRKCAASGLQRSATSMPITTSLQRPAPRSSGYVRSLAGRAWRRAAPIVSPWCRREAADAAKGETKAVSTANCMPFHKGNPMAITSRWFGSAL